MTYFFWIPIILCIVLTIANFILFYFCSRAVKRIAFMLHRETVRVSLNDLFIATVKERNKGEKNEQARSERNQLH